MENHVECPEGCRDGERALQGYRQTGSGYGDVTKTTSWTTCPRCKGRGNVHVDSLTPHEWTVIDADREDYPFLWPLSYHSNHVFWRDDDPEVGTEILYVVGPQIYIGEVYEDGDTPKAWATFSSTKTAVNAVKEFYRERS